MTEEDPSSGVSTSDAVQSVGAALLEAAKGSEDIKQAGRTVGKSLATIATTIDNALLPLAAINFGIQAAKHYFTNKFQAEFAEKIADIPPENLVNPKPSVAGPALQGLSFSIEEPDLKELYLNLLRTSVDGRVCDEAHPSFVEVIKQLTGGEVVYLNQVLGLQNRAPIVKLKKNIKGGGFVIVERFLIGMINTDTGEDIFLNDYPLMFENWIRLGLVSVDFTRKAKEELAYAWVEKNPRFLQLQSALLEGETLTYDQGVYEVTLFGRRFSKAVGVESSSLKI